MINKKKKITLAIVLLFISMSFFPALNAFDNEKENKEIIYEQKFSTPEIKNNEKYTNIELKECQSKTTSPGLPKIPVFTKKFEIKKTFKIKKINVEIQKGKTYPLEKPIEPTSNIEYQNKYFNKKEAKTEKYQSYEKIPKKWYDYEKSRGLNDQLQITSFLKISIYPIRYHPIENKITTIEKFKIEIEYKEKQIEEKPSFNKEEFKLIIISPNEFKKQLQPLVKHKKQFNITSKIITLEEIYNGEYFNTQGRDQPEQIKYFIKKSIENWNTKYVLLVGNIEKIPVRYTDAFPWGKDWGGNVLSDIYYADIYNAEGQFCSWDSNSNKIYGEVTYNQSVFPPSINEIDSVDLTMDVLLGRLPCRNKKEVEIIVNKTITYEKEAYNQIWFKKIILAGGDTFPPGRHGAPFIYEGQITNKKVAQQLSDFKKVFLWSSKRNLNALTFNLAISRGAGFVSYSGHGFEHGWGTYKPNALREKMSLIRNYYFSPYTKYLFNEDMYPIIFFDACLTAKLDYNMTDVQRYSSFFAKIWSLLSNREISKQEYLPCFAWNILNKEKSGGIASIGATRPAYTLVDKKGVYGGAGYLNVHFFKSYEEGITLGQMFHSAREDYLRYVGKDPFTLEEFILLGDPSLKVGGYPSGGFP
ncbi:MAG: C25 family cysteine peptidase [Candidatus Thermoplasmatota archaeon]